MTRFFRTFRMLYQFGFAALIIAALVAQFIYGSFYGGGFSLGYIALFISYFTILSNILVAIVLSTEASASVRHVPLSARTEWLRGLAVFCIITTGITYTFFLRGPGGMMIQIPDSLSWVNTVFHHVMPVIVALDWILFPPKRQVKWTAILFWILFAAIYAAYVEVLGYFTQVYPYFFLDPTKLHGYEGVLHACAAFIPFLLVIGGVIILVNKVRTVRFTKKKNKTKR